MAGWVASPGRHWKLQWTVYLAVFRAPLCRYYCPGRNLDLDTVEAVLWRRSCQQGARSSSVSLYLPYPAFIRRQGATVVLDKSFLPAAEGVGSELHRPFRAHCDMLSTLRHRGGKRKVGESGAAADENPGDGDGYAVKMLQRLLDVARPKQATSRSLARGTAAADF